MKAVKRFKNLIMKKRPDLFESILGRGSRIVQPPLSIKSPTINLHKTRSVDLDNRRAIERGLATEGIHHDIEISEDLRRLPERMDSCVLETHDLLPVVTPIPSATPKDQSPSGLELQKAESAAHHPQGGTKSTEIHHRTFSDGKGHAHDPLTDSLYLDVGTGIDDGDPSDDGKHVISESPSAVEMNVYETAYQEEVERILKARGKAATMYLTRRVEHKQELRDHENIIDHSNHHADSVGSGFSRLVARAQEKARADEQKQASAGQDRAKSDQHKSGNGEEKDPGADGQGNVLSKIKQFEEKAAAVFGGDR